MEKYLMTLELNPAGKFTPEEIKKAWRALCKKHHPDTGGDAEEFKKVTHAYNMLTDPSYRQEQEKKDSRDKQDLSIRMQVPVTFEQAFFGFEVILNYNREEMDNLGNLIPQEKYTIESLRITVPAGSCAGLSRAFKGKGIKQGEEVGDVEVHVAVNRHPKFQMDERGNILAQESIPLDLLIKGGKHEVQTMYGLRTLKLHPGTRPGERIAIKKCGSRNMGDHIVICNPLFPTPDDLKKEAWKGLDINWKLDEEMKKESEQDDEFQRVAGRLFGQIRGGGL